MHHKKRKPPAALTKQGRVDRVELREMKHGEGTG